MIRIAQKTDWHKFQALAEKENWKVPQLERTLFQSSWQDYAFALVDGETFCGLVTAIPYPQSGWIGNLIVPSELRGRGYGKELFNEALSFLKNQGVTSVWLTASTLGKPIYEKAGFVTVNEVERWVSTRREPVVMEETLTARAADRLRGADFTAWGEDRSLLLEALIPRGKVLACNESVALLQQEVEMQMLGPWYSADNCPHANRALLQGMLALADPEIELVVDVFGGSPVRPLLHAADFFCMGKNALMVKGAADGVDMSTMVSLASLGSLG